MEWISTLENFCRTANFRPIYLVHSRIPAPWAADAINCIKIYN